MIGRGAYVGTGVRIGNNVKIQNYALVYEPAELGDGVFVGPAVVLTNDHNPRSVDPDGQQKRGGDWEAVGVTGRRGRFAGRAVGLCRARTDRPLGHGRGRRRGDQGRAGLRTGRRRAGPADRLGGPQRRRLVERPDEPGVWECPQTGACTRRRTACSWNAPPGRSERRLTARSAPSRARTLGANTLGGGHKPTESVGSDFSVTRAEPVRSRFLTRTWSFAVQTPRLSDTRLVGIARWATNRMAHVKNPGPRGAGARRGGSSHPGLQDPGRRADRGRRGEAGPGISAPPSDPGLRR